MGKILTLACIECDYVYERDKPEKCPRCESNEYDIINVENDDLD